MPAITLNEAAKEAADNGETRKAAIIALFAEKSDFLGAMRFEGISGNAVTYTQEGELPTNAFRGVGESFVPNAGTFNPQTDALYIAGGEVDIDRFDWQTMGPQVRERQVTAKVKALASTITNAFITGSNATDPSIPDGLQARIGESTQKVANGSTGGGDPLSLSNLDLAIAHVAHPTHLLMSPLMQLKFSAAFRGTAFPVIRQEKNEIGQQIYTYAGLPILTGYPLGGKDTALLPFTEASPGGGGATSTSIYVLNLDEDGVVGISNGGISVRDLGEQNDAPTLKTRIEWYVGLADYSPFARSRLWGISNAAIVA